MWALQTEYIQIHPKKVKVEEEKEGDDKEIEDENDGELIKKEEDNDEAETDTAKDIDDKEVAVEEGEFFYSSCSINEFVKGLGFQY